MRDHDIHGPTLGNPRPESIEKHEIVNFLLRNAAGMLAEDWRCLSRLERRARSRVRGCRWEACAKNGERRYVCGFLVGGRCKEAREWGSVGNPSAAVRQKAGVSVIRTVLCAGMEERRYRRSAIPAREGSRITDGRPFWRRNRPGHEESPAAIPTVGDSRAAGPANYRRSRILAQGMVEAWQEAPRHEKSPGRTTGASLRYINFVDSSFSSTHSFSRMTGFLSTRPSRSAGTR